LRHSVRVQLLELIDFRHGIEFNSGGTTPAYALSQERCQSMPLRRLSDSEAGVRGRLLAVRIVIRRAGAENNNITE